MRAEGGMQVVHGQREEGMPAVFGDGILLLV